MQTRVSQAGEVSGWPHVTETSAHTMPLKLQRHNDHGLQQSGSGVTSRPAKQRLA
jgi:hypothetical protein